MRNNLKLDQWFRRCLKDFLTLALMAFMFSAAEPFILFGRGHYVENSSDFFTRGPRGPTSLT